MSTESTIAAAGRVPSDAARVASPRAPSIEAVPLVTRRVWVTVSLVFALVWFANLGTRALLHPDEGRYAEIAREMTVAGDWVTPRLDGLKYFEKPPLQYWLTALSFEAFGVDEWTARLPGALAGFLTVAVVAAVGSVVASPAAGLYAAAALAGSVWLFAIAHIVTLDALLTFWLTLALGAFLLARHAGAAPVVQRRWMLLAWAATAGGVLTKGLVALLIPFCTLVVYTLATRDRSPWKGLHIGRGLVVLLALAAPWFVLVSMRNPEFARFFFIHEHFERFLTTEHRRPGAWWYFLPMLVVGLLPWTGLFTWRAWRSWRDAAVDARGFAWARFCLAWAAFVFLFFSLSGSKLPSYILPIFPAAALVLGRQLEDVPMRTLATFAGVLIATTGALWLGVMIGWPRIADALAEPRNPRALFDALGPFVKLALGVATASYVLGWLVLRKGGAQGKTASVLALALGTMLSMQTGFAGSDVFRATRSSVDLVSVLEKAHDPSYDRNAPFFQVRMYDQTLPFYLGRTTTLVEYRDELSLGLDAEPERGIPRVAQWVAQWRALPQGYALMSPDTHATLAAEGVPMRTVASDARRMLVARR
ncbi:MAG: phospholipid carrier-dependent glycosyltransferase [Rudaea sp.]